MVKHYIVKVNLFSMCTLSYYYSLVIGKLASSHMDGISYALKVEYHANENPLKKSEKIAYVSQRLMYPIIKKKILPC